MHTAVVLNCFMIRLSFPIQHIHTAYSGESEITRCTCGYLYHCPFSIARTFQDRVFDEFVNEPDLTISTRPVCTCISYHMFYIAPLCLNTTPRVLTRIFASNLKLQLVMYSVSNFTTSLKSVISLRPLTCHIPVNPGLHESLAR